MTSDAIVFFCQTSRLAMLATTGCSLIVDGKGWDNFIVVAIGNFGWTIAFDSARNAPGTALYSLCAFTSTHDSLIQSTSHPHHPQQKPHPTQ
jgi:hypothetical protein